MGARGGAARSSLHGGDCLWPGSFLTNAGFGLFLKAAGSDDGSRRLEMTPLGLIHVERSNESVCPCIVMKFSSLVLLRKPRSCVAAVLE
jgi:hypothetical protein